MSLGEFDTIETYFLPLTRGAEAACGLCDDAAVLSVPEGMELIVTTDTLSAGTHFLRDQPAGKIAQKALRTNISDILSMGARPYCYQLALALPEALPEGFLSEFTAGLAVDQDLYGLFLSGGDTTSTLGTLTITITAFGLVEKGKAIHRSGARDGDMIALSGPVGDALCGLLMLRGEIDARDEDCIRAAQVPELPHELAQHLPGKVHAAADISDGLIADLGHIVRASGLTAELSLAQIEYSSAVQKILEIGEVTQEDVLTGGDDYQLVMALPPKHLEDLRECWPSLQVIGHFKNGPGTVEIYDGQGDKIQLKKSGWTHF